MKYIFTLFEIIRNPDGSFKLQSVLDRMKDVKEEHREKGIYKLLWNYRDSKINESDKTIYAQCNVDSLK